MKKTRRYLAILLCSVMLFALTACGGGTSTSSPSTAASQRPQHCSGPQHGPQHRCCKQST